MAFDFDNARDRLIDRILDRLVKRAMRIVKPTIPSATLRRALTGLVVNKKGILFVPHYWAVYVHDGRGPVRPVRKRWLVWFPNIADDPRVGGGAAYPVRLNAVRRLTKAQWADGLRKNRERAAAGEQPFMVVTKASGPALGVPFFERLRLSAVAGDIAKPEFDSFMSHLAQDLSERSTARAKLG